MQITRKEQSDGKTRLELSASMHTQAPPRIHGLLLDAAPDRLSGDRLAVASALVFQKHLRGMVTFPQPVSARLASVLTEFRDPVWFAATPVEDRGTQFGGSGTTMVMDVDNHGWRGRNDVDTSQVTVLSLLRSDRWSGRLFSMDQLLVGTNAWMFAGDERSVHGLSALLGVALLLAGDIEASRILVPHDRASDPEWEQRVARLVAAVGIEVEFCDPAAVAGLVIEREWAKRDW